MTREEAINEIKSWDFLNEKESEAVRTLIPELRESEDERLRKLIIDRVRSAAEMTEGLRELLLTYFEKQKEPKHAPDDLQKSFEAGQASIVDNPERYGLCKKTEWSEEDEKMMKNIRLALFSVEDVFWRTHRLTLKEAISYIEKRKEQKPVDYEAELKKCKDNPLYFYDKYVSIKQKPAEWSEEDKEMVEALFNCIDELHYKHGWNYVYVKNGAKTMKNIPVSDVKNWLEKLKEQKPVECIEFANEFKNQVSHLLASVLNGEHEYNEDFVKYAAQSLLGYAKEEQKPTSFNEPYNPDDCEVIIEGNATSLKRKEQKGQKTAWSDEDERMIDKICHAILVSTYVKEGLTLSEMNQCQGWMHNLSQKAVPSNERDRWLISRALEYVSMSNENDELKKEIEVCLKRRQPQSHLNPSEDEMDALKTVLEHEAERTGSSKELEKANAFYERLKKQ